MIKEFYPPETIIGKLANAYRRDYEFDEAICQIVNRNREFLKKYLLWVNYTNTVKDCNNATYMFIDKWDERDNFAYIITDKENKPVGYIDIQSMDLYHRSAKFGYFLDEKATGNGYVSDILKELEQILFDRGFIRLQIDCVVENTASNKVAIRNGYNLDGTLKNAFNLYDKFHDLNVYSKIKLK